MIVILKNSSYFRIVRILKKNDRILVMKISEKLCIFCARSRFSLKETFGRIQKILNWSLFQMTEYILQL
ncbi:hypothetical protein X798_01580 [Onchocerca flexuosa]|uniref:Uncharacterized protein n=1 Tax=Onchocerca flexuosa TaxID=387005 RepID=A0A238C221_9BILA|nr:hypothetical protein X798_01580 [Onchocerca flexuosa]